MPENDFILLSYINTKLRDGYSSLSDFCEDTGEDEEELLSRMTAAGYIYDPERNAFRSR